MPHHSSGSQFTAIGQSSEQPISKSQFLINQATLAHFNSQQMFGLDNSASNVSAFTKINSQQSGVLVSGGHSSFKLAKSANSQQQQQLGQSGVPFNFLSNQVEAVV